MLKQVIQTLGSRVASAALNFCTIIALSQYLGASGKGEASVFITYVGFMVVLSEFVGGSTLVFLTPRYNLKSLLLPSIGWTLLTSILFSVIAYLMEPQDVYSIPVILTVGFLASVNSLLQKILSAIEKFYFLSILNILQALLILASLMAFFNYAARQSVYYPAALVLTYIVTVLMCVYTLIKSSREQALPSAGFKELVFLGFSNQIAHVFHLISTRYAFIAITRNIGPFQTGVFSNAVQIAEAIWLITNSFATVQYAKIANHHDAQESVKLTNVLGRITLLLTLFALLVANLLPAGFYVYIFGPDFYTIKTPLFILSSGTIFFNLMLIYGHYFSGQGIYYYNTFSVFMSSIITVILFSIYKDDLTIQSASWITSLSYIVSGLLIFLIYCYKAKQSFKILIPQLNDLNNLKKLI